LPLPLWDPRSAGLDAVLCGETVPVIFGESFNPVQPAGVIRLPLDIIGSAFFMLSRYEELDSLAQDEHGRFPDQAALAVRAGFQQRPVIDEYAEILWAAIQRLCPDMQRAVRGARTLISCDVDLPVDPACASAYRLLKRMVGRSLRQGTARGMSTLVGNYIAVRRGEHGRDPYLQALDWIMEVNSHKGNRVAFNLIPAVTDPAIDQSIDLYDARLLDLMRMVHARGHEIGIHPGYNTYHHPNAMSRSVARLGASGHQPADSGRAATLLTLACSRHAATVGRERSGLRFQPRLCQPPGFSLRYLPRIRHVRPGRATRHASAPAPLAVDGTHALPVDTVEHRRRGSRNPLPAGMPPLPRRLYAVVA
jgi:hypothetical protein